MTLDDVKDGQRVRITRWIDIHPTGVFPAGLTGTIEATDLTVDLTSWPCANVRLDDHFPELNDWDNCLQLWRDDGEGADCTLDSFELETPNG